MKRLKYLVPAFALATLAFSCKPDLEEITSTLNADLNLNKYVAFGDYITAGYANGNLTTESQAYAYPNILAKQFAQIGAAPATFTQPLLNDPSLATLELTGFNAAGAPVVTESEQMNRLVFSACATAAAGPYQQYSNSPQETAALQNMGVPGLKIMQVRTAGLGNEANITTPSKFNPFLERILPPGDNRTYQEVAGSTKPTFFTVWLGMSDLVSFAMSGGSCGSIPLPGPYRTELASMLDTLSQVVKQPNNKFLSTRKGVLCNIPSIRDFPFAQTPDPIALQNQFRAGAGNDTSVYIWANRQIGPFIPVQSAQKIIYNDLILAKGIQNLNRRDPNLDTRMVNGVPVIVPHGLSPLNPLEHSEVLDGTEVSDIESRISTYNTEIERLLYNDLARTNTAYSNMVILADMKGLFSAIGRGIIYNGVKYSSKPVTGGIFSLDNFSLTPRGQAFIANRIIQAMNQEVNVKAPKATGFGTKLLEVNVNDYPGIKFP